MQTLKLIDLQILIYTLCFILHNGLPKLGCTVGSPHNSYPQQP